MRLSRLVAIAMIAALSVSACTSSPDTQGAQPSPAVSPTQTPDEVQWPVVIDNDQLDPVTIEAEAVPGDDRVLALAVGSGDVVDLVGAGDQLVGRDETSSVMTDVPVVTNAHQIDVEQALALKPTVVFVDELTGPPEAIDALRASGAQVIDVPPVWTLADISPRVRAIADSLGVEPDVADQLSGLLAPQTTADANGPRVAFLYLRGPSAIYLLGGANTGADALIEAAGATDVGAELGYDGFVPLTAEAIVQAAPDVLLVMTDGLESVGGIDGLVELPGIAQTTAGQQRRVVEVDDRTLLSFGARTPALVQALAEAFAAAS